MLGPQQGCWPWGTWLKARDGQFAWLGENDASRRALTLVDVRDPLSHKSLERLADETQDDCGEDAAGEGMTAHSTPEGSDDWQRDPNRV